MRLHNHIVLLCIAFVARHDAATQHGFNGPRHHIDAHAQLGGFDSIDINSKFWFVQAQIDVSCNEARILGNLIQHLTRDCVQILIAVRGLNDEVNGTFPETLAQGWRRDRECVDAGNAVEFALHLARNFKRRALALIPIDGSVDDAALRNGGIAQIGKNSVKFWIRTAYFFKCLGVFVCEVQGRAIGCRDGCQNGATVFQWRQFLLHGGINQHNANATRGHDQDHQPARFSQDQGE